MLVLTTLILVTCLGQVAGDRAAGAAELRLPVPHYHAQAGDPAWLVQAVQFHGHLGPMAVAGVRFGMAGLRAVDARGYFDIEVTCEGPFAKPPKSCFLDGLQVGTGATLGKRSLTWVPAEQILVRVRNTRTEKTVELSPAPQLIELLKSLQPTGKRPAVADDDHDHGQDQTRVEALARKVAAMPDAELVVVKTVSTP
jgi:formylmethanofuran dehydrogenase subunit E